MKRKLLLAFVVILTANTINGQVGINTETPKTTLDVNVKRDITNNITDNTKPIGLQAPRLTRAELTSNTATYDADQKGALVYITDISGGTAAGQRINMKATGYYYFDGAVWQPLNDWHINGNTATNPGTNALGLAVDGNFMGTTDLQPLTFGINSTKVGIIDTRANIMFGSANTVSTGALLLNNFLIGGNNTSNSRNGIAFGTGNTINGANTMAMAFGVDNTVGGEQSFSCREYK